MKIKSLLATIALLACTPAMAQVEDVVYDLEEDSSEVTTLKDIIDTQQKVLKTNTVENHITDVWKRRYFFNISYSNATLKSDGKIMTENEANQKEQTFKSDWGFALQSGLNYRILKRPIANTVDICLDYSWLDLTLNHYKAEPGYTYNSIETYPKGGYCSAWGTEKTEFTYAMTLGPSVTVAPFVSLNASSLAHLRMQLYYHIGYSVSGINMSNDENIDMSPQAKINNKRISWGHNWVNNFGVTLMWKGIGIGYEHRTGSFDYQPTDNKFGKEKNRFSNSYNRIYIQFRT